MKDYSKHPKEEVRKNFAYNFSGLLKLTDKKTYEKLKCNYLSII